MVVKNLINTAGVAVAPTLNYSNPTRCSKMTVPLVVATPASGALSCKRFHTLDPGQTGKLLDLLDSDMFIHPQGPNAAYNFPTLRIRLREAIECVRDKLLSSDIKILDIRVNGGAASYIVDGNSSNNYARDDVDKLTPTNGLSAYSPKAGEGVRKQQPSYLETLKGGGSGSTSVASKTIEQQQHYGSKFEEGRGALLPPPHHSFNDLDLIFFVKLNTNRDMERIKNAVLEMLYALFVKTYHHEYSSATQQRGRGRQTLRLDLPDKMAATVAQMDEDDSGASSVYSYPETEGGNSSSSSQNQSVASTPEGSRGSSKDSGCSVFPSFSPPSSPALTPDSSVDMILPNSTAVPWNQDSIGDQCYINRSLLREVYVHKMVKVCSGGDLWSLIALSNREGRNLEFKFVSSMKRQYEFSVDSFQIILDPFLLNLPPSSSGCGAANDFESKCDDCTKTNNNAIASITRDKDSCTTTANHHPKPPHTRIICESVFGDFSRALFHLEHKLIATNRPEEIRGGGLLKYCHLLVQGFRPEPETDIRSLEKYMCSRFFIDFGDLNKQRVKLDSYLRNHFRLKESPRGLYGYLLILYRVVDESTVCLMGHERREILKLIEKMFYDVYYNNVIMYDQLQQYQQHPFLPDSTMLDSPAPKFTFYPYHPQMFPPDYNHNYYHSQFLSSTPPPSFLANPPPPPPTSSKPYQMMNKSSPPSYSLLNNNQLKTRKPKYICSSVGGETAVKLLTPTTTHFPTFQEQQQLGAPNKFDKITSLQSEGDTKNEILLKTTPRSGTSKSGINLVDHHPPPRNNRGPAAVRSTTRFNFIENANKTTNNNYCCYSPLNTNKFAQQSSSHSPQLPTTDICPKLNKNEFSSSATNSGGELLSTNQNASSNNFFLSLSSALPPQTALIPFNPAANNLNNNNNNRMASSGNNSYILVPIILTSNGSGGAGASFLQQGVCSRPTEFCYGILKGGGSWGNNIPHSCATTFAPPPLDSISNGSAVNLHQTGTTAAPPPTAAMSYCYLIPATAIVNHNHPIPQNGSPNSASTAEVRVSSRL